MFDRGSFPQGIRLRTPFEILRTSTDSPSEVKLWRAVIMQAFSDATSKAKDSESINHANAAKKWLRYRSSDFRRVCAFADVEHIYIVRQAKALLHEYEQKIHRSNIGKIKQKEKARKLPNIIRSTM